MNEDNATEIKKLQQQINVLKTDQRALHDLWLMTSKALMRHDLPFRAELSKLVASAETPSATVSPAKRVSAQIAKRALEIL